VLVHNFRHYENILQVEKFGIHQISVFLPLGSHQFFKGCLNVFTFISSPIWLNLLMHGCHTSPTPRNLEEEKKKKG
jgi:hypothetical protein